MAIENGWRQPRATHLPLQLVSHAEPFTSSFNTFHFFFSFIVPPPFLHFLLINPISPIPSFPSIAFILISLISSSNCFLCK